MLTQLLNFIWKQDMTKEEALEALKWIEYHLDEYSLWQQSSFLQEINKIRQYINDNQS